MSIQEFRSRVNGIMDAIWAGGLTNHTAVIELMIYIIFLRELHVHDQEQLILDEKYKPVFSGDLAIYQWDNILSLNSDALFVHLGEAFEKLAEKSSNQTVKLLYNKAHIKLFDRVALRTVVHKIEELMKEVESEEKADRTDLFGDLYEYLLSSIAAAGTGGQFRTPRHIIKFMVNVVDPGAEESICDPACGTAGFLVAALEHLKEKYSSEDFKKEGKFPMDLLSEREERFLYNQAFTGFDSDPDMIKFGLMNLYFHKLENATVKRRNTLVDTQGETTKWDIILANPPFAGKIDRTAVAEELQMETGATEVLFLNYMIRHLTDQGRCAVIVPEGVIFQSAKAHKAIRQKLVEEAGLWAVTSLPSGVFNPYAGVKTSILFFDKTKKETNNEIAFVKISNDGFDLGAQRRPQPEKDDLPRATEILKAWKNGEKIESPIVAFVKKEKITEDGGYNLSSDRYLIANAYTNAKWQVVELNEVCDIKKGSAITKKDILEGVVPVIAGGQQPAYFHNRANREGKIITVSASGAYAGFVNYFDTPIFASDCSTIQSKDEAKIKIEFVYRILKGIQEDIYKLQMGGAQPHVYPKDLAKIKIPLPPLEIQEQIVAELDGYQNIISGAKQIIQNWNPKIDIDPGWEKVKIGDVCKIVSGVGFPHDKQGRINEKYPMLKVSDMNIEGNEAKIYKWNNTVGDLDLKELGGLPQPTGTIIFPKIGAAIATNKKRILTKPSLYDNNVMGLVSGVRILPEYLYYFMLNFNLSEWASPSALPSIRKSDVEAYVISLPPLEIQKQIVEKIESERALVESSKKLIEIYEQKTKNTIAKLWNE